MLKSGRRPTGQFLKVIKCIISMETSKITDLKILNLFQQWSTNESMVDVNSSMVCGTNPVVSAGTSSQSVKNTGISQKKGGPCTVDVEDVIVKKSAMMEEIEKYEEYLNGITLSHPTVKSIALMEYLIKLVKQPEVNLILDPFAGSGSTLVAAEQLGLDSVGIEMNEEYIEIIKKRLGEN
jgi:hypothetical protein